MLRWPAFLLAMAWAAMASNVDPQEMARHFQKFCRDYNKHYKQNEREIKYITFLQNYNFIVKENMKGHPYVLGVNEFADLTFEEFASLQLGSHGDSRMQSRALPYLGQHASPIGTLPAAVNWTAEGVVTPVKKQAVCGSSWAFAAVGALESAWKIASGNQTLLPSLSEQQLLDCAGKPADQGCSGGDVVTAFTYAVANPLCAEDSYPPAASSASCRAANCTAAIPKGAVVGHTDVAPDDEQALLEAVAQRPVAVTVQADSMTFQFYQSGVLNDYCGSSLDHGMLIVGYGTEAGMDYWLVRNSWGTTWGTQGYMKVARGLPNGGMCGINRRASYPVVNPTPTPINI